MIKFYDEVPEMTFFIGDTLPVFTITADQNIENYTMKVVVSRVKPPENNVISKDCEHNSDCFTVQLNSSDTKNLEEGTYRISFVMTDTSGLEYIKLSGLMHARSLTGG